MRIIYEINTALYVRCVLQKKKKKENSTTKKVSEKVLKNEWDFGKLRPSGRQTGI